jgi:chemotaxis protein methyltransferase CheR
MLITDEELKSLTDAIQKRHDLDFSSYEPQSLKRRVTRALHIFNMQSVHELWIKILREHGFIYSFMDEISVGLTAMFRDPIMWRKLKSLIASSFFGSRELSIWHAGCSTGEEVFTMGIVLKEAQFPLAYSARATDISNQSIQTAMRGDYPLLKMQEYEGNYKEYNPYGSIKRYFRISDKGVAMNQDLIRHVQYENHNLLSGPFTNKFDIIFCRNVMIYFDNTAKRKLFERFHDSLNDDGLLIIGFYDALLPMVDPSRYRVLDIDTKIFQKIPRTG